MIFFNLSPLNFWDFGFFKAIWVFVLIHSLLQLSLFAPLVLSRNSWKFWELTQWNINNRFKVPKWNITFFPSVFLIVKFKCYRLSIHKVQWLPQLGLCCFPVSSYIFWKMQLFCLLRCYKLYVFSLFSKLLVHKGILIIALFSTLIAKVEHIKVNKSLNS